MHAPPTTAGFLGVHHIQRAPTVDINKVCVQLLLLENLHNLRHRVRVPAGQLHAEKIFTRVPLEESPFRRPPLQELRRQCHLTASEVEKREREIKIDRKDHTCESATVPLVQRVNQETKRQMDTDREEHIGWPTRTLHPHQSPCRHGETVDCPR
jgi:hypothetical protein